MKSKQVKIFILLTVLLICAVPGLFASDKISIDEIDLPAVDRLTLDNGLRIFYIKDEIPGFAISVSVGFGKLYETASDAGISDLFADTLSLSGSGKYPGQKLHDVVENIGGRFNIQSSWEDTVITLQVLDRYNELALDIIEDILKNPLINQDMIGKAKLLIFEDIRRKQDSPEMLAFEKIRDIIYNGNGYGSIPTEKTVKSISVLNLENITDKFFTAKNIMIGISGPMEFKTIEQKIKDRFSGLRKGMPVEYQVDKAAVLKELPDKTANIYFIQKNIPQATVVMGTIAPDIKDKNIYALTLMDYILGGGSFTSRLMQEIRVKRGLAYAVQSVIRFRKKTGIFLAFAQTNTESLDTTLKLLKENIGAMSRIEVKDDELNLAKNSIRNSYIFDFATPLDTLNQYIFISYNELPESYLKNYVDRIDAVDKKAIIKNAADLLKNGLITVVVGDKKLIEKLNNFGKVILTE